MNGVTLEDAPMLTQTYRNLSRYIDQMGSTEWLLVVFIGICVGIFCLRGFGSRSGY
jgi:hypothetical protein